MIFKIKKQKKFMRNGFLINKYGFSLLEVMIALMVFAFFAASYIGAEGYNVDSSTIIRQELQLQQLTEEVMNELIINPPKFENALTLTSETKNFEREGLENFQYTITWQRLDIPDLSTIQGEENLEEEESESSEDTNQPLTNKMFREIKKYVREKLWQVEITVTNKETEFNYTLSTWLSNSEAKPELSF